MFGALPSGPRKRTPRSGLKGRSWAGSARLSVSGVQEFERRVISSLPRWLRNACWENGTSHLRHSDFPPRPIEERPGAGHSYWALSVICAGGDRSESSRVISGVAQLVEQLTVKGSLRPKGRLKTRQIR